MKKMIGTILSDLGFVTQDELNEALLRQSSIYKAKLPPEKLQRTDLIAEARFSRKAAHIPMVGEILLEMGVIKQEQLNLAVERQSGMIERYCSLESSSLCSVMDLGVLVNSSLNLAEVLKLIMQSANRVTNSVASTMMLLEEKTGDLIFSIPTGPNADKLTDVRLACGQGIAGWVAENEEAIIVADVENDDRFFTGIDNFSGFETRSILCVPLKAKTRLIGVLEVINKKSGGSFTEEDSLLLTIFASHAAMAIENARLYGELQDTILEQQRLHTTMMEHNKFKALGQMASGVAHDFNNILGAIMGHSELALMNLPVDDPAQRNLSQLLKAANRAKELVRQILAYARQEELQLIPMDLRTTITEIAKLIRASLPSTIELDYNLPDAACVVAADATRMHQLLMNLCTNASHAMTADGGSLQIDLEPVTVDQSSKDLFNDLSQGGYYNLHQGAYYKLTVSDTGTGMDPETCKHIFDPYFTTKDKSVGTGLGLSVVQGIIKSHGGAIGVSSQKACGTRFEILLPKGEAGSEHTRNENITLITGSEHILIVDDEHYLLDVASQMLERLGYTVTAQTSPVKALELFKTQPSTYNAVLTDMTMPKMTGDHLSSELLKLRPDLPIILCTGFNETISRDIARKAGIKKFLMKPISIFDLAHAVRQALDSQATE